MNPEILGIRISGTLSLRTAPGTGRPPLRGGPPGNRQTATAHARRDDERWPCFRPVVAARCPGPGSQAPARWDPFAEFEDLYQRLGQLMSGAFDGGWQPLGQS